jgi:ribose-phosphate pyrophosphokinase
MQPLHISRGRIRSRRREIMNASSDRLVYTSTEFVPIAERLASSIDAEVRVPVYCRFPSTGEYGVHTGASVRAADVTVLDCLIPEVHNRLFEHLLLLRALREGGATKVTSALPYLPYGRSDRRYEPHGPVALDLVLDLIAEAGADVLLTVDLHARQVSHRRIVHQDVSAVSLAIEAVRAWRELDTVLVAVDLGAQRRVKELAAVLGCPAIGFQKKRLSDDTVSLGLLDVIDLRGRHVVIVDDALYTGSTIEAAAAALRAAGARAIDVFVTHLLPTTDAAVRLERAKVERVGCTDSTPTVTRAALGRSVQVVSLAPLLADHLGPR